MISRIATVTFLTLLATTSACKDDSSRAGDPSSAAKTSEAPAEPAASGSAQPASMSLADSGGSYTIDPAHTRALFKIKHFDVSYQYGMFTGVEGGFSIVPDDLSKSEISLKIPTASVFTAVKKRDDHLRSPDFFDAKQFPTISFESKDITAKGDRHYEVVGSLNMHGVSNDITLDLEHVGTAADPEPMGGALRVGFNGEAVIKRSDWGMDYMQGAGLGDEVTLLFAVEGTRE